MKRILITTVLLTLMLAPIVLAQDPYEWSFDKWLQGMLRRIGLFTVVGGNTCNTQPDATGTCTQSPSCQLTCPYPCVVDVYKPDWTFFREDTLSTVGQISYVAIDYHWEKYYCTGTVTTTTTTIPSGQCTSDITNSMCCSKNGGPITMRYADCYWSSGNNAYMCRGSSDDPSFYDCGAYTTTTTSQTTTTTPQQTCDDWCQSATRWYGGYVDSTGWCNWPSKEECWTNNKNCENGQCISITLTCNDECQGNTRLYNGIPKVSENGFEYCDWQTENCSKGCENNLCIDTPPQTCNDFCAGANRFSGGYIDSNGFCNWPNKEECWKPFLLFGPKTCNDGKCVEPTIKCGDECQGNTKLYGGKVQVSETGFESCDWQIEQCGVLGCKDGKCIGTGDVINDYPWLLIVVPAAVGGYLMYNKKKDDAWKGILIGGIVGYGLYYLYSLPWWVKLLGGFGIIGGIAIFFYLGGGALIMYLLTKKWRKLR